jgi:hypothetical protein
MSATVSDGCAGKPALFRVFPALSIKMTVFSIKIRVTAYIRRRSDRRHQRYARFATPSKECDD